MSSGGTLSTGITPIPSRMVDVNLARLATSGIASFPGGLLIQKVR
jgi:hypothetical protein